MNESRFFEGLSFIGYPQQDVITSKPYFVDYKKEFVIEEISELILHISANTRYKLYVNDVFVNVGPLRGDYNRQYYDSVDITPFLKLSSNTIFIKVLCWPQANYMLPNSPNIPAALYPMGGGALLLLKANIGETDLSTGSSLWHCRMNSTVTYVHEELSGFLGGSELYADNDDSIHEWVECMDRIKITYSDYTNWPQVPLKKRTIPMMMLEDISLKGQVRSYNNQEFWQDINADEGYNIPAHTTAWVEIDAGELVTAFVDLKIQYGKDAEIKAYWAEAYNTPIEGKMWNKYDREQGRELTAHHDTWVIKGSNNSYSPYWFRSFRFIRLEVTTKSNALVLYPPKLSLTGFPLNENISISCSEKWVEDVHEISLRTLKRCMQETYVDCPTYEQMQYILDSRVEMLYTYWVGGDISLALKAVEDYHNSLTPDGVISSRFPSCVPQIIPQFMMHYILMIWECYYYTGDKSWLKRYRPTIDSILNWFDDKIGETGLVEHEGDWDFLDWIDKPDWRAGRSPASDTGISTALNFHYAYGLQTAAKIMSESDRSGLAEEYTERANSILEAINKHCYDDTSGFYKEGPYCDELSQHSQMLAVLTEQITGDNAKSILIKTLKTDEMAKCTYPQSYDLFRAFEKAGIYTRTYPLFDGWKDMIKLNLTTVCEKPGPNTRSDCHAWSALPLYEFSAVWTGIRPSSPGWKSIIVTPLIDMTESMDVELKTPVGNVHVVWDDKKLTVTTPKNIPSKVIVYNVSYVVKHGRVELTIL